MRSRQSIQQTGMSQGFSGGLPCHTITAAVLVLFSIFGKQNIASYRFVRG